MDTIWKKFYITNQYQLESGINGLAYIKDLQSGLRWFNGVVIYIDNLLIQYFWNSPKSQIYAYLDKKYCDLDNWQVVIKQAVNPKAETAQQTSLLVRESKLR